MRVGASRIVSAVVFSLLSETRHDISYYWKFVRSPLHLMNRFLNAIHRMEAWIDLTLMFLTFSFSIIWDVEIGIVVSVVISLLLVVYRSSKARLTILVCFPGNDNMGGV